MSLLLSLPEDLSRVICSEWLTCGCLGFLESALCSNICRDQFLLLLVGIKVSCPVWYAFNCFYGWVAMRGIFLTDIQVNMKDFPTSLKQDFLTSCVVVGKLDVTKFVNTLRNLTSMKFRSKSFPKIKAAVLKKLKELTVYLDDDSWFQHIEKHCHNLTNLHIHGPVTLPQQILVNNPQLIEITCSLTQDGLQTLLDACSKSISSISLSHVIVDFSTVAKVLRSCKALKHLFLDGVLTVQWDNSADKLAFRIRHVNGFHEISGWEELVLELKGITSFDVYCVARFDLDLTSLVAYCANTLKELSIDVVSIEENALKLILDSCLRLKKFFLVTQNSMQYAALLNTSGIEDLRIETEEDLPVAVMTDILKVCPCLTFLAVKLHCSEVRDLCPLVNAIRSYRNRGQGSVNCELIITDLDDYEWDLFYYGTDFSGDLWTDRLKDTFESMNKMLTLEEERVVLSAENELLKVQVNELQQKLSQYEAKFGPLL